MSDSVQPETKDNDDARRDGVRDETAIIERARRDPQSFAPLYRHYVGPVYRYCYRRLGTKEPAEDATSQTFMQAIRGLDGFDHGSFRSWLFSIAYRVVVDIYRKRRPDTTLENVADPSDPAPNPEETALAREDGRRIRSLLASLTDDQRQVLELRLAGLTSQDIAGALDRSVGSVRLLQHRAIQRLRNVLNIDPETGGER